MDTAKPARKSRNRRGPAETKPQSPDPEPQDGVPRGQKTGLHPA